jgi:tRNA G46 methylase TrmB
VYASDILRYEQCPLVDEQNDEYWQAETARKRNRNSMPTPFETHKQELHSTYFVQDRSNKEELTRIAIQDQMLTASMGGVLPERTDTSLFHRVLDVGCGTGGWAIEAAKTYPTMSLGCSTRTSRPPGGSSPLGAVSLAVGERVRRVGDNP